MQGKNEGMANGHVDHLNCHGLQAVGIDGKIPMDFSPKKLQNDSY
jgi:hypothetical protein